MLKFKGNWRFIPPPDGMWKNQTIPPSALDDFYDLIAKTTTQGNQQEILEHFKGAFYIVIGTQHVWSSSESWSETDLRDYMERATSNAPLFLEAFYDACKSLSESNGDFFAPDEEIINALCVRHDIGYEIQPPYLVSREPESLNKQVQKRQHQPISASMFIEQPASRVQPLQVFLCHSSGDKSKVRALYHRLLKDGFNAWLDEENLLPGHDWQIEIPKAVRNSDIVIVCLSKGSVTKAGYVQKEIKQALDVADEQPEGTIFIIPLKLEECDVPERLKRWQWVNLFNDNGYQRLIRSLNSRAETKNKI